jgi:hypothetical protein
MFADIGCMKPANLLILALLALTACGVEQTRPALVQADERWGHLPPDPERPQQAEQASQAAGTRG